LVAKGNPLGIQSLNDLPRIRYVNRQRGAGTRVLLDYELKKRGLSADQIDGYTREEYTHLAVGAAVASGSADGGLGIRSGAIALDLDFIPVGWERYDFAIPTEFLSLAAMQEVLNLLHDDTFRAAIQAQAGYDVRDMGKVQN
jgi:putative molybdopterin biosynthesis protein